MPAEYKFSMVVRNDGKIGYFSPQAKEVLILSQDQERWVFLEMIRASHAEIMPERITGIGMAFGSTSKTGWEKLVSLTRKAGGEIIV